MIFRDKALFMNRGAVRLPAPYDYSKKIVVGLYMSNSRYLFYRGCSKILLSSQFVIYVGQLKKLCEKQELVVVA
jgi:hypothetical protein